MSTFSPGKSALFRYALSLRTGSLRNVLASPTGFLVITTTVGYAFGYLYLVFMGRSLGPEAFGVLGSLVAIFYIACLVGQAIREAIAFNVAERKATDGETAAIAMFKKMGFKIALLSLIPTIALAAASSQIASFFHLTSIIPVIILAFSLFTALILDIVLGLFQGLQVFRSLGIVGYVLSQGLKLLFGVTFVWAGWALNGAMGALLASTAIAAVVALIITGKRMGAGIPENKYNPHLGSVLVPALTLAVFMSMPTSVDVMLATHFFSATDAGIYNAVATLGKVVLFLPMAISFVLLPRAIESYTLGLNTKKILLQSAAYALLLSGGLTVVYRLASDSIIELFFGATYAEAGHLIGWYGLAMVLFSLNFVLIHYSLAVRKIALMLMADVIILCEIAAMALLHQSLFQVILILLFGNLLTLACNLFFLGIARRC